MRFEQKSGWTITDLVKALNERNGTDQSVQNFHNKLSRESLRYKDALEIEKFLDTKLNGLKKSNPTIQLIISN